MSLRRHRILAIVSVFLVVTLGAALVLSNSRRHINRDNFSKIRVGATTQPQVLAILGPPNQKPWLAEIEWNDGAPFFFDGKREDFWYGNRAFIAITFDQDGIVRGRRTGSVSGFARLLDFLP